jgi:hypothetical protein
VVALALAVVAAAASSGGIGGRVQVASAASAAPPAPAAGMLSGRSRLGSITFADASHGWAAGGGAQSGLILATSDGGSSWQPQPVPPDSFVVNQLSFPDAGHGWAVGQDRAGSAEVVGYAGGIWSRVALPLGLDAQPGELRGVDFVDDLHGWVFGTRGLPGDPSSAPLFLATSDGGVKWTDESTVAGAGTALDLVDFVDAAHGWLVLNPAASNGQSALLSSSDGGHTWARSNVSFPGVVGALHFTTASDGYVVSAGAVDSFQPSSTFATHDGGTTWQEAFQSAPIDQVLGLTSAGGTLWLAGEAVGVDKVLSSSDGISWNSAPGPPNSGFALAATAGHLIAADTNPCSVAAVQVSTDGGSTWTEQLPQRSYDYNDTVVSDSPMTVLVQDSCQGFHLVRTVNGTSTPIQLPSGTQRVLSAAFPSASDGWVLVNTATSGQLQLWHTTDGGSTWQSSPPPDSQTESLSFHDVNHAVAFGYQTMSVTTDGGASWASVPQAPYLRTVKWIDASTVWGQGHDANGWQRLYRSTDAGHTWTAASRLSTSDESYMDYSASDATHAWIVGYTTGNVAFMVSSADGGMTWQEQTYPAMAWIASVSFAPGTTTGWRVATTVTNPNAANGLTSTVQKTLDGVHWAPQYTADVGGIGVVHADDALHAWALGGDPYHGTPVDVTSDGGATWTVAYPTGGGGVVAPPPPPGAFVPVAPVRICDTRPASATEPANQCSNRRVGTAANAGLTTLDFTTTGLAGLPSDPSQYSAVVLHVTAAAPDTSSYVTNFASGVPRPLASNLNTTPNHIVGNLVEVATGADGHLELFNAAGTTDLVVDLEGYVSTAAASSGAGYTALTPARVCDTRAPSNSNATQCAGQALGAGATKEVQVTGLAGVPQSGVTAVVLNATVTGPTQASFLTIYPSGSGRPLASSLNYASGQVVANRVTVPVGPCSSGSGSCVTMYNRYGSVDAVLDVSGYYATSSGASYTALPALRICDTRAQSATNLTVCAGSTLAGASPLHLPVAGLGVPAGATAVVANVTVTGSSQGAYLTVYPGTAAQPLASDVNFTAGQTVPNLVVTALGSDGSIDLYLPWGSADVIVDVVGYYS